MRFPARFGHEVTRSGRSGCGGTRHLREIGGQRGDLLVREVFRSVAHQMGEARAAALFRAEELELGRDVFGGLARQFRIDGVAVGPAVAAQACRNVALRDAASARSLRRARSAPDRTVLRRAGAGSAEKCRARSAKSAGSTAVAGIAHDAAVAVGRRHRPSGFREDRFRVWPARTGVAGLRPSPSSPWQRAHSASACSQIRAPARSAVHSPP